MIGPDFDPSLSTCIQWVVVYFCIAVLCAVILNHFLPPDDKERELRSNMLPDGLPDRATHIMGTSLMWPLAIIICSLGGLTLLCDRLFTK